MDAVTPFLWDACVVVPWLVVAAVWRVSHPGVISLVGFVLLVAGVFGMLTPGGVLATLAGTAGVVIGRTGGVTPRRLAIVGGLSGAVVIFAYAGWFHLVRLRPWIAEVRAMQERYPPVLQSDVLPRHEVEGRHDPHPGVPAWMGPYRLWDASPYDPRPVDPFFSDWDSDELRRVEVLDRLHGLHRTVARRFAEELGFGIVRGRRLGISTLERPFEIPAFPQPGDSRLGSDPGLGPVADDDVTAALAEYHTARGVDFANAPGFEVLARGDGSRGDAALPDDADLADAPFLIGFRPHATRTEAGGGPLMPAWRLHRVELIGLILHDEPVGYASESLPRMGETATHAVRPLTEFESDALPKLAAGAWVHAAADDYRLRALGALPAAKACAECHGVPVGTLLGALSYDFLRELR